MQLNVIYPVKRRNDISSLEVEKGIFITDMKAGAYFRLNSTGKRVWELIDGRKSAEEIVRLVTNEFAVEEETTRKEVGEFLENMKENKLVDFVDAPLK